MRMNTRLRTSLRSASVIAGLSLSGPVWAAGSMLPPEARVHNERGVELVVAGALEQGVEELQIAYDLMPDALVYRAGRGTVIGSIRSALNQLYARSGDPRHLCRLRSLQERHLEALRAALGDSLRAQDVAGSEQVLRETQGALARRPEADPCSEAAPALLAAPRPAPTALQPAPEVRPGDPVAPLHPPRERRRGLQVGGGVLLAVGAAALGAMTYGSIVAAGMRREIERKTAVDPIRTPTGDEEIAALYRKGFEHRTLAVAAGVIGGMSVITGAILVGRYHRGRTLAGVAPVFGPGYAGMTARLRF